MTVPIVGDTACNAKYNPLHHIVDSMICAGVEEGKTTVMSLCIFVVRSNTF